MFLCFVLIVDFFLEVNVKHRDFFDDERALVVCEMVCSKLIQKI